MHKAGLAFLRASLHAFFTRPAPTLTKALPSSKNRHGNSAAREIPTRTSAATFARRAETESLRNSLLNAISHDLRTPLAVLVGASSSLVDQAGRLSDAARRELAVTIHEEAKRMSTLVGNLLDMARLESGAVELARQWTPLEEIVGSVLARLKEVLVAHPVRVSLPRDLPLVSVDPVLLEQVFANLLENAAKYTPAGTPVEISAQSIPGRIVVEVADAGPVFHPAKNPSSSTSSTA